MIFGAVQVSFTILKKLILLSERGEMHWKVCDDFLVPGTHIKDG